MYTANPGLLYYTIAYVTGSLIVETYRKSGA